MTAPSLPTTESVLSLLDREIDYAHAQEQRGGWTLWALTGALGGSALLILDQWEAGGFSAMEVAKWVVLLSIPVDAFVGWVWTWAAHDSAQETRRYRPFREFENQRLAFLWRAIYTSAIALLAVFASSGVWTAAVILTATWYGFLALFSLIVVFVAGIDWPYIPPKTHSALLSAIIVVVIGTFAGVCAIAYARSTPRLVSGHPAGALKLAVLLVFATQIVLQILLHLRRPWVVGTLVKTRRALALGKVDVSTAARTAEISLMGMEPHTALEEHLLNTLDLHDEALELYSLGRKHLHQSQSWSEDLNAKWEGLTQAQRQAETESFESSVDAAENHITALKKIHSKIEKRMKTFERQVQSVEGELPHSLSRGSASLRTVFDFVQERNGQLTQALADIEAEWSDCRRQVDKLKSEYSSALT